MPALAYLVLVLLVGGGVSVASQGALPGSVLYPVKIHVNEAVQQSFAFSDSAKAKLDADLAVKRLEEAETVAAKSHLNSDARAQIESNFKEHADRVETRMMDMSSADAKAAADLIANFETSLSAHAQILSQLKAKADNAEEAKEIDQLHATVNAEDGDAAKASSDADAKVSSGASADVQSAAEGKMNAAQNKIDEVQAYFNGKKAGLSGVVTSAADARLALARSHMAEGKVSMQAKKFAEAFMHFSEAQKTAQEAKLLLDAKMNLDVEVNGVGEDGSDGASGHMNSNTNLKVQTPSVNVNGNMQEKLNY